MHTIKFILKIYFCFTAIIAANCDNIKKTNLPPIQNSNNQKNNSGPCINIPLTDKNRVQLAGDYRIESTDGCIIQPGPNNTIEITGTDQKPKKSLTVTRGSGPATITLTDPNSKQPQQEPVANNKNKKKGNNKKDKNKEKDNNNDEEDDEEEEGNENEDEDKNEKDDDNKNGSNEEENINNEEISKKDTTNNNDDNNRKVNENEKEILRFKNDNEILSNLLTIKINESANLQQERDELNEKLANLLARLDQSNSHKLPANKESSSSIFNLLSKNNKA